MAFADIAASFSGKSLTTQTIGETDWNDPDSVAQCKSAIWDAGGGPIKLRAEAQAKMAQAFHRGDQWAKWDGERRQIENDNLSLTGYGARPDWEKRLQYNLCPSAITMKTAKVVRNNPEWDVPPATEDPEDEAAARISKDVLDWYWSEGLKMPEVVARTAHECEITKTVVWELMWDRNAGDPVSVTTDQLMSHPQAPPDMMMAQLWATQKMGEMYGEESAMRGSWSGRTGDVRLFVRSLFEVNGWPFNCTEFDQFQVLMVTFEQTAREVSDEFNIPIDVVRSMARARSGYDRFHRNIIPTPEWQNSGWRSGSSSDERDNDSVLVHKLFLKRSKEFPRGRMAIVIGEDCIFLEDNPYRDGCVPLIPVTSIIVSDSPWGRSTMDDLISIQKDLNLGASQESNYRNYTYMPTLCRIMGDGLEDDDFENAPGYIPSVTDKDHVPVPIVRPPLGSEYGNSFQRNLAMFREVSGVGQVDYGTSNGGNPESGRGILALQEQNDMRTLPFYKRLDRAIEKAGAIVLEMLQDFAADNRVLRLVGENNAVEVIEFNRAMLRPKNYGQEGARTAMVRVQSSSQLPSTRAETRQLIDSLSQIGYLDPKNPIDKRAVLRMYGVGSADKYVDQDRKHIAQADSEQQKWASGQIVGPPSKTDKHEVHIEEHFDFANTEDYRNLLATQPMVAQDFIKHIDEHMVGVMENQLKPQFYEAMAKVRLMAEFTEKTAELGPAGQQMFMAMLAGGGGQQQSQQSEGEQSNAGNQNGRPSPKRPPQNNSEKVT